MSECPFINICLLWYFSIDRFLWWLPFLHIFQAIVPHYSVLRLHLMLITEHRTASSRMYAHLLSSLIHSHKHNRNGLFFFFFLSFYFNVSGFWHDISPCHSIHWWMREYFIHSKWKSKYCCCEVSRIAPKFSSISAWTSSLCCNDTCQKFIPRISCGSCYENKTLRVTL